MAAKYGHPSYLSRESLMRLCTYQGRVLGLVIPPSGVFTQTRAYHRRPSKLQYVEVETPLMSSFQVGAHAGPLQKHLCSGPTDLSCRFSLAFHSTLDLSAGVWQRSYVMEC